MPGRLKLFRYLAILLVLSVPALGQIFSAPVDVPITITSSGGSTPFTALHTYFMAPTTASPAGNDANSGLDAAHPWASPNHSVVCGDVIIAAAGTYAATGFQNWGAVSSCPSTTGGIDGTGGVYAAAFLCAGDLGTAGCVVNYTGSTFAFNVTASNWAVEGWQCSTPTSPTAAICFVANPGVAITHDIYFVNNICSGAGVGFATHDNNDHLVGPAAGTGVDYYFVVGNITYNCAQLASGGGFIASASIVNVAPNNSDSNTAAVHSGMYGNVAYKCQNASPATSDGECYMWDTLDAHGSIGIYVAENNIGYQASWVGFQIFEQTFNSSAPTINNVHNTLYANLVGPPFSTTGVGYGELQSQFGSAFPWTVTVQNNIHVSNRATVGGGSTGKVYARHIGGATAIGHLTNNNGGLGNQNILKGIAGSCEGSQVCDAGFNEIAYDGWGVGTNTYSDPVFQNTTDLLANHLGAPDCTGFTSAIKCVGWDYATQTATTNSIIYDLTPTAAGMSGKGYTRPGSCAANSNYSPRLKGLNYLQYAAGSLVEVDGLTQKPCGL